VATLDQALDTSAPKLTDDSGIAILLRGQSG
jgi:hypothetical protein